MMDTANVREWNDEVDALSHERFLRLNKSWPVSVDAVHYLNGHHFFMYSCIFVTFWS